MDELTPYIPSRDLQLLVCSYTCPHLEEVVEDIQDLYMYMRYYHVSIKAMLYLMEGHKTDVALKNWQYRYTVYMEREMERIKRLGDTKR